MRLLIILLANQLTNCCSSISYTRSYSYVYHGICLFVRAHVATGGPVTTATVASYIFSYLMQGLADQGCVLVICCLRLQLCMQQLYNTVCGVAIVHASSYICNYIIVCVMMKGYTYRIEHLQLTIAIASYSQLATRSCDHDDVDDDDDDDDVHDYDDHACT